MEKEKRIISYFWGWLLLGIIICFVGCSNVLALNVNSEYVKLFDNYGTSLTEVNTAKTSSPTTYWTGTIPTIVANSNGAAIIIQTDTPLAKGVNYSISINLTLCNSNGSACYNPAISTKFNLGLGTSVANTKSTYFDNTAATVITKEVTGNYIYYNFTTKTNGSYILIPFTSETTCNGCIVEYYGYELISNGLASELSSSDITNITNSQTNELNNSIQNSTDTITGEIDDMEQSIIDSNKETQDVIKDQFNSCKPSSNLFKTNNIWSQGAPTYNNTDKTFTFHRDSGVDYIIPYGKLELKPNTNYVMYLEIIENTMTNNFSLVNSGFLNNGNLIIYPGETGVKKFVLKTKSEATIYDLWFYCNSTGYLKTKIMLVEGTSVSSFEPYGEEICSNKIDETNDKLGNLNDSLNDSNVDSSLNNAGSFFDSFQSTDHGGLSGIVTAPLVAINEMLNTSCNPMTTTFKGKELSLPCGYEFWNKMGAIQDFLNVVLGGMLCYNIVKKLFKLIERIKNPEDDRVEVMDL